MPHMQPNVEHSSVSRPTDIDRRGILKTAAWSLPVLAVAVAAPTATASGALGRFVIESMTGGSWVSSEGYGGSVQLRNDDTHAGTLPVPPITSGTLILTFPRAAVGAIEPVLIVNDGVGPSVPSLPATDPTWTAGGATDNGDGTVSYTLFFTGSLAGQGVARVSFGVLGSNPLQTGFPVTATSTGAPTDGFVSTNTGTLW